MLNIELNFIHYEYKIDLQLYPSNNFTVFLYLHHDYLLLMFYLIHLMFSRIPINYTKLMKNKFNKVVLELKALHNIYRLDVMPKKIHQVL